MDIMCIAQVENGRHIADQICKQTVQPDATVLYVDDNPAKGIDDRRVRIAENHAILREKVIEQSPDFVWQVEGDCVLPEDTLERLLADYEQLKGDDFGFISGIQVGRHGLYCLGAWTDFEWSRESKQGSPLRSFRSIDHNLKGIQRVAATGFYCLFAPTDVWLSGECSWDGEPYGPDVVWGLSINKRKYVDMDIQIGHKVRSGVIWPHHASTCSARFYKEGERWKYKQL